MTITRRDLITAAVVAPLAGAQQDSPLHQRLAKEPAHSYTGKTATKRGVLLFLSEHWLDLLLEDKRVVHYRRWPGMVLAADGPVYAGSLARVTGGAYETDGLTTNDYLAATKVEFVGVAPDDWFLLTVQYRGILGGATLRDPRNFEGPAEKSLASYHPLLIERNREKLDEIRRRRTVFHPLEPDPQNGRDELIAQAAKVISEMSRYYRNVICTRRLTLRTRRNRGGWNAGIVQTDEVGYSGSGEWWRAQTPSNSEELSSIGDYFADLTQILFADPQAHFQRQGESKAGTVAYRFATQTPFTWWVVDRGPEWAAASSVEGFLEIERATGRVIQWHAEVDSLPPALGVKRWKRTVILARLRIGDFEGIFPERSITETTSIGDSDSRLEGEFSRYRHFESQSVFQPRDR